MPILGAEFPNFSAETNRGPISFHKWLGDSWGMLFTHPADFTPVCTTELAKVLELEPEFTKRNVKLIAFSCDSKESHNDWLDDIEAYNTHVTGEARNVTYPIIADPQRDLAVKFGILDPERKDDNGKPLPARSVFIVGSDKTLKLSITYPASTGRNFDEILRVLDSLQLTAREEVATPVNWYNGDAVSLLPSLSPEDASAIFGDDLEQIDLPSGRPYMRFIPHPDNS